MRVDRIAAVACTAIGFLLACASASATVIPIRSSLQVDVDADVDGPTAPAPLIQQTDRREQGSTLNTLGVSATAVSSVDGARVSSNGTGTATWNSASAGTFRFDHVLTLGVGTLAGTQGFIDGANRVLSTGLTYTFSTDADATFSLDFTRSVSIPGLTLPCCDFWTRIDGALMNQGAGFGSSGTLSLALLGPGTHTIQITPGSVGAADAVGGATRSLTQLYSGTFDWSIVESIVQVPEPSTVALFLAGLLVVPSVRRRARVSARRS